MPFTSGVGILELVIILVIVMIIFGVGRLPEIGAAVGKAMREFRSEQSGDEKDDEKEKAEVDAGMNGKEQDA